MRKGGERMKLNCEVVKDVYLLYKEDELSSNVKKAVEEHLGNCEECKTYYDEQAEYTSITARDKQLIEPSKKLDEKLKLKLKLRRLQVVLIFVLSMFVIYSYFNYVDQRKTLLYELQNIEQSVDVVKTHLDKDNLYYDENTSNNIKNSYYNLTNGYKRIERNLNYLERKEFEDKAYTLTINYEFLRLLEQMNQKSISNELTFEDKVALGQMRVYFMQYEQLLNKEISKLEAINDKTDIKAILNTLNIEEIAKLTNEINQLSLTYYKYNKFPKDTERKSEQAIEEILTTTFNSPNADVTLNLYEETPYLYSFEVKDKDKLIYGGIDAYTGQFMNIIDKSASQEGSIFISEDEALTELNKKLKLIFGDGLDFEVTNLGLNYDFDRNREVEYDYGFKKNPENIKHLMLYTYRVTPVKEGYEINSQYIMRVDARTGELVVMYLDYSFNTKLFDKTIEFNTPKTIIDIEDGLDLIANEKDKYGEKINYEYAGTLYIRSKVTGNYELVHQYNSYPFPMYTRYIKVGTGKEDFLY